MDKEKNICFALDFWAKQQPQKVAVHTENRSISYQELHEQSSQFAGMLREKGLVAQDRVLVFMPNCIEYMIVFFAAVKLNLNIVPVNVFFKRSELSQTIQMIHPKLAFVADDAKAELLHSVDKHLPIICAASDNTSLWKQLHPEVRVPAFPGDREEASIFVSTSGSTGNLKFVSNTYQNELINASLYLQRLCVTKDDVSLTGLPVTQKFGMAAMLGSCISGCTMVLPSRFDAKKMISLIQKHHVTVQYGVPTMYAKEIEAYTAAEVKPDISSLRSGIIAGAAGATDIFRWFDTNVGCHLLNCYGTTEVGGLTMAEYHDSSEVRYNTCGRAFQGATIEIIDKNGNSLPPGEDGEIVCTVPWVMTGYIGAPTLTAQMFDSQKRFLTGDIGKMDETGNLIINGRKKDMIIRGGYNIFPAEVEIALLKQPDVSEACVVGYQDACLGERICAFVKIQEGGLKSSEKIRHQLEQHIAKYKLPDRIIFVDDIPKLANGKSNYPALSTLLQVSLR